MFYGNVKNNNNKKNLQLIFFQPIEYVLLL